MTRLKIAHCSSLTTAMVVLDIFRVENKRLTMGKTSFFANGSSGQTRATERNKDLGFSKK
ncbi:MAG: hypothetical protein NTZ90_15535 [Proteobacteria bacterium]|nr:hypothetical protein [Pseudomonadota bacterium]